MYTNYISIRKVILFSQPKILHGIRARLIQNASASKTNKSTTMTRQVAMGTTEPKDEKKAFHSAKGDGTKVVNQKTSDRLDRLEEMLASYLSQKLSQGFIKTQHCLSYPTNNTICFSNQSNQPISFRMSNVGSGPEIIRGNMPNLKLSYENKCFSIDHCTKIVPKNNEKWILDSGATDHMTGN